MKQWRLFYKTSARAKTSTTTILDEREELTELISKVVRSGGVITDIKWLNRNTSARETLLLLKESGLDVVPK